MMEGMQGPHQFEITVNSNDTHSPITKLDVTGDFERAGGDNGQ